MPQTPTKAWEALLKQQHGVNGVLGHGKKIILLAPPAVAKRAKILSLLPALWRNGFAIIVIIIPSSFFFFLPLPRGVEHGLLQLRAGRRLTQPPHGPFERECSREDVSAATVVRKLDLAFL